MISSLVPTYFLKNKLYWGIIYIQQSVRILRYSLVSLDKRSHPWKQHPKQNIRHAHRLGKLSHTPVHSVPLTPCLRQPLISFLSLPVSFLCSKTAYVQCTLLCMVHFIQHEPFETWLCCRARQWCAPYFREHSVVWLYQFVPRGLVSQIRLLRTFVCKSSWGDVVCSFVLSGEIPRSDLEESRRVWKTIREIVFHNDLWFYPPVSNVGEFQLLHILVNTSYCCSL